MMGDMSFRDLQRQQKAWVQHNFPDRAEHNPLLGVVEELGELAEVCEPNQHIHELVQALGRLAHARLKGEQGIRGSKLEHQAAKRDAIGDISIFLCDYCTAEGFDWQEIMDEIWGQVRQRDWKKDSLKGGEGAGLLHEPQQEQVLQNKGEKAA